MLSLLHLFSVLTLNFCMILQQQLQSLLETLSATEPHYIRCIKPNNVLKPGIFENSNVLQQLRCGVNCAFFVFIKRAIFLLKRCLETLLELCSIFLWKQSEPFYFLIENASSCDKGLVETTCHSSCLNLFL